MDWDRVKIEDQWILYSSQIMALLAVYTFLKGYEWLFFTFLFGTFITFMQYFYMIKAGNGLLYINDKKINRMNINDEDDWVLSFHNKGLPILRANLIIKFNNRIEPTNIPYTAISSAFEVRIPFKAMYGEEVEIKIPILAKKRGIATIQSLEIHIPHLFGSGVVILNYSGLFNHRRLIFPIRKFVSMHKKELSFLMGYQDTKTSLYFDPTQPIGVREYQNGDSFQYIHWKASARSQQLQTKVFTNIHAKSWMIFLNMEASKPFNPELENLISYTAYLVDFAIKENIPFSLAINAKTFNKSLYYYLSEGEGSIHRQQAMEMLAYLSVSSFTVPCHLMIKHVSDIHMSPPFVIHVGELNSFIHSELNSFKSRGSTVFTVKPYEEQGVMEQWK